MKSTDVFPWIAGTLLTFVGMLVGVAGTVMNFRADLKVLEAQRVSDRELIKSEMSAMRRDIRDIARKLGVRERDTDET